MTNWTALQRTVDAITAPGRAAADAEARRKVADAVDEKVAAATAPLRRARQSQAAATAALAYEVVVRGR